MSSITRALRKYSLMSPSFWRVSIRTVCTHALVPDGVTESIEVPSGKSDRDLSVIKRAFFGLEQVSDWAIDVCGRCMSRSSLWSKIRGYDQGSEKWKVVDMIEQIRLRYTYFLEPCHPALWSIAKRHLDLAQFAFHLRKTWVWIWV